MVSVVLTLIDGAEGEKSSRQVYAGVGWEDRVLLALLRSMDALRQTTAVYIASIQRLHTCRERHSSSWTRDMATKRVPGSLLVSLRGATGEPVASRC